MKRIIALFTVLMLLCIMPAAFAQEDAVTLFDFGAVTSSNVNAGDSVVTVGDGQTVSYKTPGAPDWGYGSLAFQSGQMNVTLGQPTGNGTINMIGIYGTFADNFKSNYANYNYIRFYAKNGSEGEAHIGLFLFETQVESAARTFPLASSITMYDMDGNLLETTYTTGYVILPGSFEGYVFIKLDYENWTDSSAQWGWGGPKASFDNIACAAMDIRTYGNGTDAASVVACGNMELVETETLPVATDSTQEPGSTDQPATTADVSTIAYAAAAVIGCGALVIKKKK